MASSQSCSNHHVLTTCCDKSQECKTFTDLPSVKVRESELCNVAKQYRCKNRFIDVLPFDDSRVILQDNTFINASFIQQSNPTLIATQSPMTDVNGGTVEDFWTMAWEQDTSVIINLSPKPDDAAYVQLQPNCHVAFSTTMKVGKKHMFAHGFGKMSVFIDYKCKDVTPDISLTKVIIEKHGIQKTLTHVQVKSWLDMSPLDTITFATLLKTVRNLTKDKKKQSIVCHCTAGIGRTGTFLGAYIKLFQSSSLSTFEIVEQMRKCRPNMVQKKEQYEMIESIQKSDLCINIIVPKSWTNKARVEKVFNSKKMRFEYRLANLDLVYPLADQKFVDRSDKPRSVPNYVDHHFVITHYGDWPKEKSCRISNVEELWQSSVTDIIILCKPGETDLSMYWPTPELDIQYCGEELASQYCGAPSIIIKKRNEIIKTHLFKKSGKIVKLIQYFPKKTIAPPTNDPFLAGCYQMESLKKSVEIYALEAKLEKTIHYLKWN